MLRRPSARFKKKLQDDEYEINRYSGGLSPGSRRNRFRNSALAAYVYRSLFDTARGT